MQRVTISIDETLAEDFDSLINLQGYQSRSEAVRDLVRQAVDGRRLAAEEAGDCVASLSYVFDHHTRALAKRLIELQHEHHDIVVATTHIHLDHHACLETSILKGSTTAVRALADAVKAERGVRFAAINVISVVAHGEHAPARNHHHHGSNGHSSPRSA